MWLWSGLPRREQKIAELIEDATTKRISNTGHKELDKYIREYSDVLQIHIGKGPAAEALPTVSDLNKNTRRVRAAQPRYPPEKREFLEETTTKLTVLTYLRPSPDAQ